MRECYSRAFPQGHGIVHQQCHPLDAVPVVSGFSQEDSLAIWKICTNAPDKSQYTSQFDGIVRRVSPDLPGSPASDYEIGFGDCNHDGTSDWVCTYERAGYLWGAPNRKGAYTFIMSGKKGDAYAEYLQDANSPDIGYRLVQPWMREWQGKYGSCNGASTFARYSGDGEWIRLYQKDLGSKWILPF